MTAQIPEKISIDGETFAMCTEPLSDYFFLSGQRPEFAVTCTALWRGYEGKWEILNDRLYLVGLTGTLKDGTDVSLVSVFPEFPDRVFAHWYCGQVRIPKGKLLEYVHGGYASTYERDLLITFDHGVATASSTEVNGVSADEDEAEGYEIAAMTTFPTPRNRSKDED